jgi:hypothetical protein
VSGTTYWVIALVIGLAAALIVTALLIALLRSVNSIEKSVDGLLTVATGVAGNTANIPQLEATAPVLAGIVDEAVVQDGYMNALTDGFGDGNGNQ